MRLLRAFLTFSLGSLLMLVGYSAANAEVIPNSFINSKDPGWKLQKDENDIKVYFKEVEGSNVKAFMGKKVMSASVSSILKVMKDVNTCGEWIRGCIKAIDLEGSTFEETYQYGINDLPWPANDRDFVNQIITSNNPETGDVTISLKAVEGRIPLSDNVRLKKMYIQYTLSPISENETSVTWVQHTEPGGNIPNWLVNMLLIDIPYYSLTRLEGMAKKPEYRSAQIIHDKDRYIRNVK